MSLTLYTVSGSPRAWRVLLGLTFKKLDWDTSYLSLEKREHRSPAYLKINPRGTVPTLVTDDGAITDSLAALAWLDAKYPARPLFGRNPLEAAAIWSATRDATCYLRKAHNDLFAPIFFQGARSATDALRSAAQTMSRELDRMEDLIGGSAYVVGDHPTAADAVRYPEIRFIERAMGVAPELLAELGMADVLARYPRLAAWKERIENVEGFAKTLPPHWSA